jgi:hypothetical protein
VLDDNDLRKASSIEVRTLLAVTDNGFILSRHNRFEALAHFLCVGGIGCEIDTKLLDPAARNTIGSPFALETTRSGDCAQQSRDGRGCCCGIRGVMPVP